MSWRPWAWFYDEDYEKEDDLWEGVDDMRKRRIEEADD